MSKGKKISAMVAALAVTAVLSGLTTLAVTNYGSQDDPLITLSYLNETVMPELRAEFEAALEEKAEALTVQLKDVVDEAKADGDAAQPSGFAVLTLSRDQVVVCGVGTEIMLRIGTAVSAGDDSPRLIDETSGSTVGSSGRSLTANHMYMVTIEGNGIKATRDNTKILIRGDYTVE